MLNKFNAADLVIRAALTGLTSLRHVSLRCVDTLSDDTLVSIAMTVPELQYLDVGQCSRITDEGVSAVSRHCGRLTHLDLAFTRITDAALKGLNRGGTLTTLVLTECSDVEALPFNTASLTSFSVGGLTAIPPEWLTGAIQPLIHHATTLEVCGKQSAPILCGGLAHAALLLCAIQVARVVAVVVGVATAAVTRVPTHLRWSARHHGPWHFAVLPHGAMVPCCSVV